MIMNHDLGNYAKEIIADLENRQHPFITEFPLKEFDGAVLAQRIRSILRYRSDATQYTITVKSDRLFIGTRKQRRLKIYEQMIRRLALHVDDENLYDEAQKLVGTI